MTKFFISFLFLLFSTLTFQSLQAETEKVHRLIACENSLDMLQWDLEFIKHAEQTIEFSPCFFGGDILNRILNAVEKRIQERPHLQFHLLTSATLMVPEDERRLSRLMNEYPENIHIQKTTSVLNMLENYSIVDNHIKCLIVDEKYFSMGGTNFDDALCTDGSFSIPRHNKAGITGDNLPSGARDQDVVGAGPMAKELRILFFNMYAMWKSYFADTSHFVSDPALFQEVSIYKELTAGNKAIVPAFDSSERVRKVNCVKLLLGAPCQKPNQITSAYVDFLNKAQSEVILCNMYFMPAEGLFESIVDVAHRGIALNIITNGGHENAPSYAQFFCWVNRQHYLPCFLGQNFGIFEKSKSFQSARKKTEIYEYDVRDILYHKKIAIIDKRISLVGSYNLGPRSDSSDYEILLAIYSEEFAKDLLQIFEKDKLLSKRVSLEQAREWFFDPWISYMAGLQKKYTGFL